MASMLLGLLCALGCSVCFGVASVLQAMAAREVSTSSSAALMARVVRDWRYLTGLAVDGLGFVLQVAALRSVPIYVVAAALAGSIAITATTSAVLLSTRLSRLEWSAVGMVIGGLSLLGIAAGPQGSSHGPHVLRWALWMVIAVVVIIGAVAGRLQDTPRALALGVGSGIGFGVVEVGVRLIDTINPIGLQTYLNPALYAVIAGGAVAFTLLTQALQRGKVTTAVAGMVMGETIAPALVGITLLGDATRPGYSWMVVAGFVIAIAATLTLARFGGEETSSADQAMRPPSGDDHHRTAVEL